MTDGLVSLLIHKSHYVILLKIRSKNKQVPDRFNSESELSNANFAVSWTESTKEMECGWGRGRAVQVNTLWKIMSYKVMVRQGMGIQQLEKEVEKSKSDYEVTCHLWFLDVNATVETMKKLNK